MPIYLKINCGYILVERIESHLFGVRNCIERV